jgi:multidrug efflux system membrane fusion protein
MSKNVRISLYILIPVIAWMISGQFVEEKTLAEKIDRKLSSVVIAESPSEFFSPSIKINSSSTSEKRVNILAKTSGEVMPNNVLQGDWVEKDQVLCRLGVVELNRTEVKAPFKGYIERIVKPGNYISKGQTCAVIIELDPITFVAEVPETEIKRIINNQNVEIALVTGEVIKGKLTFVSKSASTSTRTFRVEAKVSNASGNIRDGITGTMTIQTNKVLANKISPSILLLSDEGDLGVRVVDSNDKVKFLPIKIIEDTNDGIWVTGIPNLSKLIVLGQGFVKNGEKVRTTFLTDV